MDPTETPKRFSNGELKKKQRTRRAPLSRNVSQADVHNYAGSQYGFNFTPDAVQDRLDEAARKLYISKTRTIYNFGSYAPGQPPLVSNKALTLMWDRLAPESKKIYIDMVVASNYKGVPTPENPTSAPIVTPLRLNPNLVGGLKMPESPPDATSTPVKEVNDGRQCVHKWRRVSETITSAEQSTSFEPCIQIEYPTVRPQRNPYEQLELSDIAEELSGEVECFEKDLINLPELECHELEPVQILENFPSEFVSFVPYDGPSIEVNYYERNGPMLNHRHTSYVDPIQSILPSHCINVVEQVETETSNKSKLHLVRNRQSTRASLERSPRKKVKKTSPVLFPDMPDVFAIDWDKLEAVNAAQTEIVPSLASYKAALKSSKKRKSHVSKNVASVGGSKDATLNSVMADYGINIQNGREWESKTPLTAEELQACEMFADSELINI